MKTLALFVGGTVVGYLALLFGWIGYTDVMHVADGDGGKIMGVAFTLAPVGSLVIGLALAILFGHRTRPAIATIETRCRPARRPSEADRSQSSPEAGQ